ncbi:succinate-semialdehyde dehydrogenase nadp + [Fusarium longipes]|uniref:Succinate-semialdehyde dehydrogenase, mitochondrial n=1 Tax=Fusarium longipes TaxID=694270 RepID=A0A395T1R8_9HYPO|nr:succinate-semialdehyde dehydrogenase nadp + [Fusarium longipes]
MNPTPPFNLKNPSLFVTEGLVAGEWRPGTSGKTFPVIEPSSGEELSRCADLGLPDFVEAIDVAHKGYKEFSTSTTAKERGILLRKWNDLIISNVDDLALILSLENGKTLTEAKGEVLYAASFVAWFAEEATRSYGDTIPSSFHNTVVMTFKEPVGVCGLITPWNFPAAMITRKVAPAIAAGCSVVVKPPSETPFSALALAKLALNAGLPSSCIHIIPTKDRSAATELATNPKVSKLSFTGSTNVGKMLTKLAAGTMKKVSMELGGNAPLVVFDSADLELAVEGAMISKFRATGQTCVCANRIFVQSSLVDEFSKRLVTKVKELKLGKGTAEGITQGPLVNAAAVNKVDEHVQDAIGKGAKLLTGGKTPDDSKGFFYEPTVLVGATNEMKVATDETFGPLAAIFPFETEQQAVDLANNTEFGLAGYFFSRDIGQIMRVAQAMECGMIGVNTGLISAAESPFGGIKESGVGREGSKYGLAEFQNIKSVTIGNIDR